MYRADDALDLSIDGLIFRNEMFSEEGEVLMVVHVSIVHHRGRCCLNYVHVVEHFLV